MLGTNRTAIVVALGIVLVAAGCGSSNNSSSTSSSTSSTSPSSAAGAHTVRLSADSGGALKFDKTKLDAGSGKVTVVMTNPASSGVQHGIAVEGNGVDKDGPIVAPGKTSTLTVSLKPGKYEYYCPFDSHKAQGMTGTLTVGSSSSSGGSAGGAGTSTPAGSTGASGGTSGGTTGGRGY